jgi:GAF domain-containing protein
MSAMPDSTLADPQHIIADLQRQLAECRAERDEALARETATAEVLQVINASPGDLAPVFDALLDRALALCGGNFGFIRTYDGEAFNLGAMRGVPPELTDLLKQPRRPPFSGTALERIVAGESVVQIADIADDPGYHDTATARAMVAAGAIRTMLWVALRKEGALLGFISVFRSEIQPFTDKQIALLQNFAAQAVIAMESARLWTETREALEQQTATAEVLQVINSSPGDLAPVFDAILEKAHTLCGATRGSLFLFDGGLFRAVATHGYPPDLAAHLRQGIGISPVFGAPLLAGARIVHTPDLTQVDDPIARAVSERGGVRTNLLIPLRREGALLGVISCNRHEVRPFAEKEISLLHNFAAQAVIAMENARLLTETREALEQQTATAEVLGVINSSPGDLAPVFDAMLKKALALCGAAFGTFHIYSGERIHTAAHYGVSPEYAQFLSAASLEPTVSGPTAQFLRGAPFVHLDAAESEMYREAHPLPRLLVDVEGGRTLLAVPLRKDNALLGMIVIYRREVCPFTDKQIALLQNFAAQAVIAMENARLLTETREALEQQTATAEVLQVINSSPGDLAPVFDAMLEKATRLCEAAFGNLYTFDGRRYHSAAVHGKAGFVEWRRSRSSFEPGTTAAPLDRLVAGERVVAVDDALATEGYRTSPGYRRLVDASGVRSGVTAALRKDDALLGAITVYRQEVRPFSDKQIALLQNFAAQAVIAMENARLITETREALEQQTATAEVLQVINSSPGDLTPVFAAILQKAHSLCGAAHGTLMTYDGEYARAVATQGVAEPLAGLLRQPFRLLPSSPLARLVRERCVMHIPDQAAEAQWEPNDPRRIATTEGGVRTMLFVPLRKGETVIGWIAANRLEVRPFSEKEISLLESFASQAVIAMENARLLDEIRQRQAELRVTFDNMVDGVVMFDEGLRLAAWNRNFQELLQLPDEFLAERPGFDEYIRYLTRRGEFGETDAETQIARLRARLGDQYSFERTRPDGGVLEVRHNPMPGGGIVLIYSDITERKRSEAAIRAARDAAEAAYRDLKAAQASLIQAEKMASLGQLTAGIAHEIKNPLNFVNNFAGLSVELLDEMKETATPVLAGLDADKRAEFDETVALLTGNLERIAEHGRRADNIVKSMLEHSRSGSGERRAVDLNGLVDEALNLAYHGARAQDQSFEVALERDFEPALAPIELAPQEMTRVFLNLFGNGFYAATKRWRASPDAGFRPTLRVSTRDTAEAVEIRVRDNGVGIAPDIRDKLFQPFFTTKPAGEGTGLGLSISWDIITQQHGGAITVDSREGEFTEFTIRLPRSRRPIAAEAAS